MRFHESIIECCTLMRLTGGIQVAVFEDRSAVEIVRGIRAFFNKSGQWIVRRGRTLRARARRQLGRGEADGITPENVVWIFGAGRTGSTWLSQMMGELEGYTVWFEPWVGALFDPYHLRLEDRKG